MSDYNLEYCRWLAAHIPVGKENAISRAQLAKMWATSDRNARAEVAQLRQMDFGDGMAIISASDGKGYYRTDNLDEIQHFVNECRSRARNIMSAASQAEKILKGANADGRMVQGGGRPADRQ